MIAVRRMPGRPRHSVKACILAGYHEQARSSLRMWHALVFEIGASCDGNGGAIVTGNCVLCFSTIARPVHLPAAPDAPALGDAPPLCECGRTYARCECARLFGEAALARGCL